MKPTKLRIQGPKHTGIIFLLWSLGLHSRPEYVVTVQTPNMVTYRFSRTEKMEERATTYFKLIHHFADPTSFLAYDVTVKIKGNFHLNGDRNQSL